MGTLTEALLRSRRFCGVFSGRCIPPFLASPGEENGRSGCGALHVFLQWKMRETEIDPAAGLQTQSALVREGSARIDQHQTPSGHEGPLCHGEK